MKLPVGCNALAAHRTFTRFDSITKNTNKNLVKNK